MKSRKALLAPPMQAQILGALHIVEHETTVGVAVIGAAREDVRQAQLITHVPEQLGFRRW